MVGEAFLECVPRASNTSLCCICNAIFGVVCAAVSVDVVEDCDGGDSSTKGVGKGVAMLIFVDRGAVTAVIFVIDVSSGVTSVRDTTVADIYVVIAVKVWWR